jgi:hypothetical protein
LIIPPGLLTACCRDVDLRKLVEDMRRARRTFGRVDVSPPCDTAQELWITLNSKALVDLSLCQQELYFLAWQRLCKVVPLDEIAPNPPEML